MVRLRTLLLGTLIVCGMGCAKSRTYSATVQHYRRECMSLFIGMCLQVLEEGETTFSNYFISIQGFEYEWGNTYQLRIKETKLSGDIPLDAPGVRRDLISIIDVQAAAGTEFDLTITAGDFRLDETSPGVFSIHGERDFTCGATQDCDTLRSLITAGTRIEFRLAHPSEPSEPLELIDFAEAPPFTG